MRALMIGFSLGLMALATPQASAQTGGELLAGHLSQGTLAHGVPELAARVAARPRDQELRFALGLAQIARAGEKVSQGLYRYGFSPPTATLLSTNPAALMINPAPQPVSYEALRQLAAEAVRDLDEAAATLALVDSPQVKVRVNLADIRFDVDGDGRGSESETVGSLLSVLMPAAPAAVPRVGGRQGIAFDRADAIWLRGYANLVAAPLDFILAHNFEPAYTATFHRFFPSGPLPMVSPAPASVQTGQGFMNSETFGLLADAVAFVHLLNGPVVEPERRLRVRQRLLQVVALSRQNLAAIEAERDNDAELLPNSRQVAADGTTRLSEGSFTAWRAVLTNAEQVLNGQLLVPHWRFRQGVDVRRLLDEGRDFDPILIATGQGVVPYLRAGPVLKQSQAMELASRLGTRPWLTLFWFN